MKGSRRKTKGGWRIMINDWSISRAQGTNWHVCEFLTYIYPRDEAYFLFLKVMNCPFITTEGAHINQKDDGANPRTIVTENKMKIGGYMEISFFHFLLFLFAHLSTRIWKYHKSFREQFQVN